MAERDLTRLQQDDDAEHHDALGEDQHHSVAMLGSRMGMTPAATTTAANARSERMIGWPSDLPELGCAEQAFRTHQQHQHHDQVGHQHLEFRLQIDREGARQPIISAAIAAPPIWPSPAVAATANDSTIISAPMPGTSEVVGEASAPPSAASVAPITKVIR